MKKVEIETPKYETVQVGINVETKWETSDGRQFTDERSADMHEFYQCKVKHRGNNLPVDRVELFDFSCVEDLERYEKDYMYNDHIKKYEKLKMEFPNTFVLYEVNDPDWEPIQDLDSDYAHYDQPDTHVHFVTLDEYKKLLIKAAEELS